MARKLRCINSEIQVEAIVADAGPESIEGYVAGASVVLDGTDNFETRYLLNDVCVKLGVPWVYGGVVGTWGMVMPVLPGQGPCLCCVFPEPPAPGTMPTCDVAGVLNTAPVAVAAVQVTHALRLLTAQPPTVASLLTIDLWNGTFRTVPVRRLPACPCCVARQFEFLDARRTSWSTVLCGREAVQIAPPTPTSLDLPALAARLGATLPVSSNGLLLEFTIDGYGCTVFPDGRVLVRGTTDVAAARSLVAKYLGT